MQRQHFIRAQLTVLSFNLERFQALLIFIFITTLPFDYIILF